MVRNDDIRLAKHMMHFISEVKSLYSTAFVHIHFIERTIVMLLSEFPPSHVHVYLRYIWPFIIFCETIFFSFKQLIKQLIHLYLWPKCLYLIGTFIFLQWASARMIQLFNCQAWSQLMVAIHGQCVWGDLWIIYNR